MLSLDVTDAANLIEIQAPTRLHFGLLSFGNPARRQFGGLGVMLDQPALRLQASPAEQWQALGPHAERVTAAVERCLPRLGIEPAHIRPQLIQVLSAPRSHLGLGSGTQLGLSVAAALLLAHDRPIENAVQLARIAGRGERSAVGSHGFFHGGLIAEAGKLPHESLAPLIAHRLLPRDWRVLLITPTTGAGLHGNNEQTAFANLPPVPDTVTDRLANLILSDLLPAVQQADFASFSESLYQYGLLAGSCFATVQGGPFASAAIAQRVAALRAVGIAGVGQSSWGPLVFAWCESQCAAGDVMELLSARPAFTECEFQIAAPAKHGALIRVNGVLQMGSEFSGQ